MRTQNLPIKMLMREVPVETAASTESRSDIEQLTTINMGSESTTNFLATQEGTPWPGATCNNFLIDHSEESVSDERMSQQRRA